MEKLKNARFTTSKVDGNINGFEVRLHKGKKSFSKIFPIPIGMDPENQEHEEALREHIKAVVDECRAKYIEGRLISSDLMFSNFAMKYIESIDNSEEERGATTINSYKHRINVLNEYLEHLSIDNVTKSDIIDVYEALKKRVSHVTGKSLKTDTLKSYMMILENIFEYAVRREIIETNPVKNAVRFNRARSRSAGENKMIQQEDIVRLIKDMDNLHPKLRLFFFLLLGTGARRGEIGALTWDDIDYENGYINIDKNIYKFKGQPVQVGPVKGRRARTVAVDEIYLEELRKYKVIWDEAKSKVDKKHWHSGNHIFNTYHDNGMWIINPNWATCNAKIIAEKYDYKIINPHSFRHAYASMAIAEGANIVTVSKAIGHASPKITADIYTHAIDDVKSVSQAHTSALTKLLQEADAENAAPNSLPKKLTKRPKKLLRRT